MTQVKVEQRGDRVEISVSAETARTLGLEPGAELTAVPGPAGLLLSPHPPRRARHLLLAQQVMDDYADALARLAE